ncbi:hypothetical protein Bca101_088218 [Brassica carinata]
MSKIMFHRNICGSFDAGIRRVFHHHIFSPPQSTRRHDTNNIGDNRGGGSEDGGKHSGDSDSSEDMDMNMNEVIMLLAESETKLESLPNDQVLMTRFLWLLEPRIWVVIG